MKKLVLLLAFSVVSLCTFAQDYKAFRWGLGLGYASPGGGGEGAKGGVLLYTEPSYRVNDQIAVGLRLELAVMARVAVSGTSSSSTAEAEVKANGSYTINGQYYFGSSSFRPFLGAGFGVFQLASATASANSSGSTSNGEVAGGTKIGFYPRAGFDIGHFTMNLEYNIIPKTEGISADSNGNLQNVEIKNGYLGFKLGFFIGGGKK
jgi:hypothetical protein